MSESILETTVGRLATERPEAVDVLERAGVDYCCGGERSLMDACRAANVDPQSLLDEIDRAADVRGTAGLDLDWSDRPLAELCDHIKRTHHAFLREQLPLLEDRIDKVVNAHAATHPELIEVRSAFAELRNELEPHMMKEERILFPAIRALEQSDRPLAFPFGTVQNPIRMMEHEHDNAGQCLRRLRELTSDYSPPEDACPTYLAMLDGLQNLEADLHRHIHKENNILFPRAAALEQKSQPVA